MYAGILTESGYVGRPWPTIQGVAVILIVLAAAFTLWQVPVADIASRMSGPGRGSLGWWLSPWRAQLLAMLAEPHTWQHTQNRRRQHRRARSHHSSRATFSSTWHCLGRSFTLLDLTVNISPLGILFFFIVAFAVFPAFGTDPVFSGLQFALIISMFLLLAVLTYYAGTAVENADERERRTGRTKASGQLQTDRFEDARAWNRATV